MHADIIIIIIIIMGVDTPTNPHTDEFTLLRSLSPSALPFFFLFFFNLYKNKKTDLWTWDLWHWDLWTWDLLP
jgi:hypothetical protein